MSYYRRIIRDDLLSYNLLTQIYTVEDKTEVEVYAPTARETRAFYNPTWFPSSELKEKIKASWSKVLLVDNYIQAFPFRVRILTEL